MLFQVDTLAVDISLAVSSILANPNVIPDLTVSSVNINGRTYLVSSASQNTQSNEENKIGLLAGILVGVIVIIILVGIFIAVYIRNKRKQLRNNKPLTGNIYFYIIFRTLKMLSNFV